MDRDRDYNTDANGTNGMVNSYADYGTYNGTLSGFGPGGSPIGTNQDQFQQPGWQRQPRQFQGQRQDRNFPETNRWHDQEQRSANWRQGAPGSGPNQGVTPYGVSDRGFGEFSDYGQGRQYDAGTQRPGWNRQQTFAGGFGGYGQGTYGQYGQGQRFGRNEGYGGYGRTGFNQHQGYGPTMGDRGTTGSYGTTIVRPDDDQGANYETAPGARRGGMHERQNWFGPHSGKGPARADERIADDVSQRLTEHGHIDASNVDVRVTNGVVKLTGKVDSRQSKRIAGQVADMVTGVRDIDNELTIDESLMQKIEDAF